METSNFILTLHVGQEHGCGQAQLMELRELKDFILVSISVLLYKMLKIIVYPSQICLGIKIYLYVCVHAYMEWNRKNERTFLEAKFSIPYK